MPTERQQTAIQFPCWRARETMQAKYFRLVGMLSTILSINK